MKRFIPLFLFAAMVMALSVYSAAPTFQGDAMKLCDTLTINVSHSASKWKAVNTTPMVYSYTDTGFAVVTVSGVALLNPGGKLYIGIREVCTNDSIVEDTFIFQADETQGGLVRMPFTIMYVDSLLSQTDDIDSVFVNAACGGSVAWDYVKLENVYGSVVIIDKDAGIQ